MSVIPRILGTAFLGGSVYGLASTGSVVCSVLCGTACYAVAWIPAVIFSFPIECLIDKSTDVDTTNHKDTQTKDFKMSNLEAIEKEKNQGDLPITILLGGGISLCMIMKIVKDKQ